MRQKMHLGLCKSYIVVLMVSIFVPHKISLKQCTKKVLTLSMKSDLLKVYISSNSFESLLIDIREEFPAPTTCLVFAPNLYPSIPQSME